MAAPKKYPDELMERGIRLVFESGRPIAHVARDLGVSAEALRKRVRRSEVDAGRATGSVVMSVRSSSGCGVRTSSCAARTRS